MVGLQKQIELEDNKRIKLLSDLQAVNSEVRYFFLYVLNIEIIFFYYLLNIEVVKPIII